MIRAVIFDWAGTTVDFGSNAPMGAFVKLFKKNGIDISIDEARIPMGTNKWDHIDAILKMPRISEQWREQYSREYVDADVDRLLEEFVPMNKLSIVECSALIPGVLDVFKELTSQGVKIGTTTGYTRELMEVLLPLAAEQGYEPEFVVCAGETSEGRPSSKMMEKCSELLGVHNPLTFVKVDDTLPGIDEGKNFGCWTVGVAVSGNALGLSEQEISELPPEEFEIKKEQARKKLLEMSPDFVIDSVADLGPIIHQLNFKIAQGEKPNSHKK